MILGLVLIVVGILAAIGMGKSFDESMFLAAILFLVSVVSNCVGIVLVLNGVFA